MQYIMEPRARVIEPWAWWDDVFTNEELDFLQNKCKNACQVGVVGTPSTSRIAENIRRSNVDWLECTEKTSWVFSKISNIVGSINARFYGFELTGMAEPMQLTHYDSKNYGTYDWHQDYNADISRKLSLVLQLTDPSEYEGGDLQLFLSDPPINIPKKRGLIVVFPSYAVHRVTPVTKGTRQTLVSWISGPSFK